MNDKCMEKQVSKQRWLHETEWGGRETDRSQTRRKMDREGGDIETDKKKWQRRTKTQTDRHVERYVGGKIEGKGERRTDRQTKRANREGQTGKVTDIETDR